MGAITSFQIKSIALPRKLPRRAAEPTATRIRRASVNRFGTILALALGVPLIGGCGGGLSEGFAAHELLQYHRTHCPNTKIYEWRGRVRPEPVISSAPTLADVDPDLGRHITNGPEFRFSAFRPARGGSVDEYDFLYTDEQINYNLSFQMTINTQAYTCALIPDSIEILDITIDPQNSKLARVVYRRNDRQTVAVNAISNAIRNSGIADSFYFNETGTTPSPNAEYIAIFSNLDRIGWRLEAPR